MVCCFNGECLRLNEKKKLHSCILNLFCVVIIFCIRAAGHKPKKISLNFRVLFFVRWKENCADTGKKN